jgi:uncharacterized protein DUF5666
VRQQEEEADMARAQRSQFHTVAFFQRFLATLVAAACVSGVMTGCGSGMKQGPGTTQFSGTTSVTVLITSAANGHFSSFIIPFQTITLTNNTGETVTLLDTLQIAEFSHLNGSPAILAKATVPQGIYTSGKVTFSNPSFTYIKLTSTGGISTNTDQDGIPTQSPLKLAAPVTITGTAMGLLLELDEAQSVSCTCTGSVPETFSIAPVLNLSATTISVQPVNFRNGKLTGISGRIKTVNSGGSSLSLTASNSASGPNNPDLSLAVNPATLYQGVGGLASLSTNMFADVDAALQSDGSLLATRVEVRDPAALNTMAGPVIAMSPLIPELIIYGRQEQGDDMTPNPINMDQFNFGGAVFQTSGEFTIPANLPFTPLFSSANIVNGQNIAVSFGHNQFPAGGMPVNTVTLLPQTINGTIAGISTSGSFTVYQVALPSYDLIPVANGANTVAVYVNADTQILASAPVTLGSVVRFNGLLLNDSGTLRMVAARVLDGTGE